MSWWPDIYYCLTVAVLFLWGALSDERTGLSFVSVPKLKYFNIVIFRHPFIKRHLFENIIRYVFMLCLIVNKVASKTAVNVYDTLMQKDGEIQYTTGLRYIGSARNTQKTSRVIRSQWLHWCADCCLATINNIRPLRHVFRCCTLTVFTKSLPRNALSKSITISNDSKRQWIVVLGQVLSILYICPCKIKSGRPNSLFSPRFYISLCVKKIAYIIDIFNLTRNFLMSLYGDRLRSEHVVYN
jgi:hypothetical protein